MIKACSFTSLLWPIQPNQTHSTEAFGRHSLPLTGHLAALQILRGRNRRIETLGNRAHSLQQIIAAIAARDNSRYGFLVSSSSSWLELLAFFLPAYRELLLMSFRISSSKESWLTGIVEKEKRLVLQGKGIGNESIVQYRKRSLIGLISQGRSERILSQIEKESSEGLGADVAKWFKAVDCESTTRGFNPRHSPIKKQTILGQGREKIKFESILSVSHLEAFKGIQARNCYLIERQKAQIRVAYFLKAQMEWRITQSIQSLSDLTNKAQADEFKKENSPADEQIISPPKKEAQGDQSMDRGEYFTLFLLWQRPFPLRIETT